MEKVKFIKSNIGICIYLDDGLFKDNKVKLEKILQVLNLFSFENLSVKSECFIDEGEPFVDEIKDNVDCTTKTLFTRKRLFGKKNYSKVEIIFKGSQIGKVIEIAINCDLTLEADCYDSDGILTVMMVVNDNNGTCIHFNTERFDAADIKTKTALILKG